MIILITYHQTIGLPFILLMNNLYVWSAAHGCGPGYIVNKSWHQSPNASSDAHCFLRQAEPDNGEQIALNVHPAQAEATLPIRSELHLFCLEPGMWLTSSSTTTRLRPPPTMPITPSDSAPFSSHELTLKSFESVEKQRTVNWKKIQSIWRSVWFPRLGVDV